MIMVRNTALCLSAAAIVFLCSLSPAARCEEIALLYQGLPCSVTERSIRINLVTLLMDAIDEEGGELSVHSIGNAALSAGGTILFNHHDLADISVIVNFLETSKMVKRLLIRRVTLLDSPFEMAFQIMEGESDITGRMQESNEETGLFPDMEAAYIFIVKYVNNEGEFIYAAEFEEENDRPLPLSLDKYELMSGAKVEISFGAEKGVVYNIGKPLSDISRNVKFLRDRLEELEGRDHLHVSVGSFLPRKLDYLNYTGNMEFLTDFAIDLMKSLRYDALLPTGKELLLEKKIADLADVHGLPYISLNLCYEEEKGGERERVFPSHKVMKLGDRKVLVTGLNSSCTLEALHPAVKEMFHILPPGDVLDELEEKLITEIRPDLVVVLTDSAGEELQAISNQTGVDILIGDFSKYSVTHGVTEISFDKKYSPSKDRYRKVFLSVSGSPHSAGIIKVTYDDDLLVGAFHENFDILWDMEPDEEITSIIQPLLMKNRLEYYKVWLPDVSKIITKKSEYASFIWGDEIIRTGEADGYLEKFPARFTDNLWMNFVTNVLYKKLKVNVVFSRNLPRNFDVIGPIDKYYINDWLNVNDAVLVTNVTGSELGGLLKYVKGELGKKSLDKHTIFVSGADPESMVVEGRALKNHEYYSIAVSDYLATLPAFKDVLKKKKIHDTFIKKKGSYRPSKKGRLLLLRDVIIEEIVSYIDEQKGEFDQEKTGAFLQNIGLTHDKIRPRWMLDIKKIGFSFNSYGAYNNHYYTETTETRVVTPGSYTYGGDLDLTLLYDDARVEWENRARMAYSVKEITKEGKNISRESIDDIVFNTEIGGKILKIPTKNNLIAYFMPFINFIYDTEFTPTVDTSTGEDNPHQHLLYSNIGLSFQDEKYLKKLYVSYLMKDDFAQERGSFESGIGAGFVLEIPYRVLKFGSELTVRYFPPHRGDTIRDLGFTVRFTNSLTVKIFRGLGLHFSADYYLFKGKVAETDHPGMSLILSGGISFSRLFIWNT